MNELLYNKENKNRQGLIMLDLHAIYEVVTFAIGDTKAGSKMGKL